ncbi:MAG TPA: DUF445 family protein [Chitinophagaceae bacterium]|jgi:uncharacterized membrane protein YheB (UPF0754 family)|nr:DUF445 family protein [Chitinophagaceae bacterium]
MNYWLLLIIPLSSAAIGWLTMRIAIYFLFHPGKPRKLMGITFHGIFPKRREEFAIKLGKTAHENFSFDSIEEKINNPETLQKILPLIEDHIDDFLRNRLGKEMPMISMFIGEKTIDKLKSAFLKEIELLFPQVMKQYASNLKQEFDIEQIVVEKLMAFSPGELEKLVYTGMKRELKLARITGAVIGLVIGLGQVLFIWLLT